MATLFSRRGLMSGAALAGLALAGGASAAGAALPRRLFPRALADAEWRRRLTPMQYYVLRQEGTERPFSHPLAAERRAGRFACAGCGTLLFSSSARIDSESGWPAFSAARPGAVARDPMGHQVHCTGCGGHLGHQRRGSDGATSHYAVNGAALHFTPA